MPIRDMKAKVSVVGTMLSEFAVFRRFPLVGGLLPHRSRVFSVACR